MYRLYRKVFDIKELLHKTAATTLTHLSFETGYDGKGFIDLKLRYACRQKPRDAGSITLGRHT